MTLEKSWEDQYRKVEGNRDVSKDLAKRRTLQPNIPNVNK